MTEDQETKKDEGIYEIETFSCGDMTLFARVPYSLEGHTEYIGQTVFTRSGIAPNGQQIVQPVQAQFPIEADSVIEAFDKFKDAARARAKEMDEEAQKASKRVILPNLQDPGNGRLPRSF